MNANPKTLLPCLAMVAVAAGLTTNTTAQDPLPSTTPKTKTSMDETANVPGLVKGSSIIDARVTDSMGEEVGRVHDLIVQKDGKIVAAVLETERDNYAAVPLDVLESRGFEDDETGLSEITTLTLKCDVSKIESAPIFTMTRPIDDDRLRQVHEHFSVPWMYGSVTMVTPRDATDPRAGTDPTGTDGDPMNDDPMDNDPMDDDSLLGADDTKRQSLLSSSSSFCLASDIIDAEVVNTSDEDLGEIGDLAVSCHDKRIEYAVLERGLFDVKRIAVPYGAIRKGHEDEQFILDVSEAELEEIEGFDERWPSQADTALSSKVQPMSGKTSRTGG